MRLLNLVGDARQENGGLQVEVWTEIDQRQVLLAIGRGGEPEGIRKRLAIQIEHLDGVLRGRNLASQLNFKAARAVGAGCPGVAHPIGRRAVLRPADRDDQVLDRLAILINHLPADSHPGATSFGVRERGQRNHRTRLQRIGFGRHSWGGREGRRWRGGWHSRRGREGERGGGCIAGQRGNHRHARFNRRDRRGRLPGDIVLDVGTGGEG